MATYDVVVVGTGGVGSAALFYLASRGARVLGIDRFAGPHNRGSSHGQTRIIRQAYFEHPDYVPLLKLAYDGWDELEQRYGRQLFFETGLLQIGPPDGVVVPGVLESAARHALDVQQLSRREATRWFPGFRIPDSMAIVLEQHAGYLLVEDCVQAYLQEAVRAGATLQTDVAVDNWKADDLSVSLRCNGLSISAGSLVLTPGAWAPQLLADLAVDWRVLRKHLHWFENADPHYRRDQGCPVFLYELADGMFYGFPQIDQRGVKVAEHTGGTAVADPLQIDRTVDPADRQRIEHFLTSWLPGVSPAPRDHEVCMYTMSPDGHFLVGRHPRLARVAVAAGLSGHGFKFAPVLGRALADLVLDGRSDLPIDFLRPNRNWPVA